MTQPPSRGDEGPEADLPVANPTYIGTELAAERARGRGDDGGDGSGGEQPPGSMSNRVVHLEHRMGGVEAKLDRMIGQLGGIATRAEMRNYLLLAVALFVAVAAMLVTGMGWLETRAGRVQQAPATQPPPQPIIIQFPGPVPARAAPVRDAPR